MRRMRPAATHSHEIRGDSDAGALAADRLVERQSATRKSDMQPSLAVHPLS
eukprot:COSAG02_NODE_53123_length_303_cov_2.014706_1_plen_50_part_10